MAELQRHAFAIPQLLSSGVRLVPVAARNRLSRFLSGLPAQVSGPAIAYYIRLVQESKGNLRAAIHRLEMET